MRLNAIFQPYRLRQSTLCSIDPFSASLIVKMATKSFTVSQDANCPSVNPLAVGSDARNVPNKAEAPNESSPMSLRFVAPSTNWLPPVKSLISFCTRWRVECSAGSLSTAEDFNASLQQQQQQHLANKRIIQIPAFIVYIDSHCIMSRSSTIAKTTHITIMKNSSYHSTGFTKERRVI